MSKLLAAASAAALFAGPAAALTAPELWEDWQAVLTNLGLSVEAETEDYADGTLTLDGLSMTSEQAIFGEEITTETRIDGAHRLVEEDDGSVRIELPAESVITSTTEGSDGPIETVYTQAVQDAAIVARDAQDGARLYDVAMGSTTLSVDDVSAGEAETPVPMTIAMTGIGGTHRTEPDGTTYAQDYTIEAIAVDVDASANPEPGSVALAYENVATSVTGALPDDQGDAAANNPFTMGMTYDGTLSHGGGTLRVAGENPQGSFQVESRSGSGQLDIAADEAGLGYDIESRDVAMTFDVPSFPLPVSAGLASSRTALTVPIAPNPAAPWAMEVALRDLTVDDALWSLVDPTGQLPRDPATLSLSLDGEAEVTADLFADPDAAAEDFPIRPLTANVTELLLTAAGVRLAGTGALRFPEDTPVPDPVGTIDLVLDGGLALADRLVALGLIPQQQAMFARAMIGGFATQTGEDTYESTIEFTPGGGITANGTPIR